MRDREVGPELDRPVEGLESSIHLARLQIDLSLPIELLSPSAGGAPPEEREPEDRTRLHRPLHRKGSMASLGNSVNQRRSSRPGLTRVNRARPARVGGNTQALYLVQGSYGSLEVS